MAKSETVYISGPMTGHHKFNYESFHQKETELRAKGHAAINPAVTGEVDTAKLMREPDWHDYMVSALNRMRHATAIHFLEGWEDSFGARIEAIVAEKMEIPII